MRLMVFAAVLIAACAFGLSASQAQTTPKIRVATTPIDLGAEALYAAELGLFKKAGLDVDLGVLTNGTAVAAAVSGGSIDIGQSNLVALADAHGKGFPFVVVAPAGYYSSKAPTTIMITAANSPIKTAKDLDGKVVTVVALRDITQVGASSWLVQNGADLSSVKFVEVPQPAVCTAITAGRADAGVVSEPFQSVALANGCRVLAACHDTIGKEFLVGAWFSTNAWADAHPDLVKRFRAVIVETARWANTHREESAKILEKYTKLALPPQMKRVVFAEKSDPAQMQPLINAAAKYGALKAPFPAADLLSRY